MALTKWFTATRKRTKSVKAQDLLNAYLADMELPGFSGEFYYNKYPDVQQSGLDALSHYLLHGWLEGRDPSPGFSTSSYLLANPDVAENKLNPLLHFLKHGITEGRGGWQVGYYLQERPGGQSFREDVFHYYRRKVSGE